MNIKKAMLREDVQRLQVILSSVDRLPAALRAECRPSLALALAEAADLMQLASWLEAHGTALIAGIAVSDEGCVLRHLRLAVDISGWPVARPLDGQTMFSAPASSASQIIKCVRAALASTTAPVVLLDAGRLDTVTEGSPARIAPMDAAPVLHALRAPSLLRSAK